MSDLTERLRSIKVMRLGGDIGTPVHCGLMPDPLSNEAADALDAKDAEIAVLLADAERMDWLKNNLMAYDFAEHAILIKWPKCVDFKFGDLRGSIDAARGTR